MALPYILVVLADYRFGFGRHICGHVIITLQSRILLTLKAEVRVVQNPDAKTQYIAIPSAVVQDSLYPFHKDDMLDLEIDPKNKTATLRYPDSGKKTR